MEHETMTVVILGRTVGTASGWDEVDTHAVCFYNFESTVPGLHTCSCFQVNFETGIFQCDFDGGSPEVEGDIVPLIAGLSP